MRKSTLLKAVALCALVGGGCFAAQAESDLEVLLKDGSKQAFNLAGMQRITFVEGGIVVLSAEGKAEIPYATLQNIQFTIGPSGASSIFDEANGLAVRYADGALLITRNKVEGPLSVALYSAAGAMVINEPQLSGDIVDVRHLPAGVYVAKINKTILKFIKN